MDRRWILRTAIESAAIQANPAFNLHGKVTMGLRKGK
jgi:hypothetical protein